MTQQEFTSHMTFMGMAYNKEFSPEQMGVWYTFFADVDGKSFISAIKRLIVKSKYMPSIADIKDELVTLEIGIPLDADAEWERVRKAISKYGYYRQDEAMASLPEVTAKTVRRLGGFRTICSSEDPSWTRKAFIDSYKVYAQRERQTLAISESHRTPAELGMDETPQIEEKVRYLDGDEEVEI